MIYDIKYRVSHNPSCQSDGQQDTMKLQAGQQIHFISQTNKNGLETNIKDYNTVSTSLRD